MQSTRYLLIVLESNKTGFFYIITDSFGSFISISSYGE